MKCIDDSVVFELEISLYHELRTFRFMPIFEGYMLDVNFSMEGQAHELPCSHELRQNYTHSITNIFIWNSHFTNTPDYQSVQCRDNIGPRLLMGQSAQSPQCGGIWQAEHQIQVPLLIFHNCSASTRAMCNI